MQAQVKAEAGMAAVAGQATLTSSVAAQAEVSAMQVHLRAEVAARVKAATNARTIAEAKAAKDQIEADAEARQARLCAIVQAQGMDTRVRADARRVRAESTARVQAIVQAEKEAMVQVVVYTVGLAEITLFEWSFSGPSDWEQQLEFKLGLHEPLQSMMNTWCKKMNLGRSAVSFHLSAGEVIIQGDQTPYQLEMNQEFCWVIEVKPDYVTCLNQNRTLPESDYRRVLISHFNKVISKHQTVQLVHTNEEQKDRHQRVIDTLTDAMTIPELFSLHLILRNSSCSLDKWVTKTVGYIQTNDPHAQKSRAHMRVDFEISIFKLEKHVQQCKPVTTK